MSGTVVAAKRRHSSHWFIPCHSPLKPCLFAFQSTLSCASAWEFSVLGFEQPTVSSAPNVPNSTGTRKQKPPREHSISHCPRSQNSPLLFPLEKILRSNLETNIRWVEKIACGGHWVWHLQQRQRWRVEERLHYIHPQMALSETSLINMSVREWYAPERTTFWKHNHHSATTFLSVRFNVFIRPLMEAIEEDGEEYLGGGEQYVLQGL